MNARGVGGRKSSNRPSTPLFLDYIPGTGLILGETNRAPMQREQNSDWLIGSFRVQASFPIKKRAFCISLNTCPNRDPQANSCSDY